VWSAVWLLLPLGTAGAVLTAVLAPWLAGYALRVPPALAPETERAFLLLALAIPFTVLTAGLRGVLEATQEFGRIALLRIPLALATFAGPVLVAAWRPSLVGCLAVLVAGRAAVAALHVRAALAALPEMRRVRRPRRGEMRALVGVGGWLTVSNVVSPLMVSLDRFVVGAVLSLAAVTYYATAYEAVTRLWVIPTVVLGVLFPALSVSAAADPGRAAALFDRGARATLLAVFPVALALSTLAPEWLAVWVGPNTAVHAAPLAQGLAGAVLVNVSGMLAYALVQSVGRADFTGRLHLAEVGPYALVLWALLHAFGTRGVVAAWGLRVVVDTTVLLAAGARLLPQARPALARVAVTTAIGAPVLLAPAALPARAHRLAFGAVALVAFGVAAWRWLVTPAERAIVRSRLPRRHLGDAVAGT
jgi:O-antigen/teichoic acid export membrane protein